MNPLVEKTRATFTARFGRDPEAVSWAPGRMEILGNHTDYNGGYILSVALELGVAAAAANIAESRVEVFSAAFRETRDMPLDRIERRQGSWANYPFGVIREIQRSGVDLRGMQIALESNLPLGAGVSSSAAVELATAEVVYALSGGRPAALMDEARLCQRAEADFAGVPCGLLDQFSSLFGRRGHALFLDCLTLEHARMPLGRDDVQVVVAASGVKHALVDGHYARLRAHCERAARGLAELLGREVRCLREVSLDELLPAAASLDPEDRRRAEHVIRENARVLEGRAALEAGRVERLGELMMESHASSRDLFGNSSLELDFLVSEAARLPGCLGGKLSGGGFGGSTVHLVLEGAVEPFGRRLAGAYERRFGCPLALYPTRAGDGARGGQLGP